MLKLHHLTGSTSRDDHKIKPDLPYDVRLFCVLLCVFMMMWNSLNINLCRILLYKIMVKLIFIYSIKCLRLLHECPDNSRRP